MITFLVMPKQETLTGPRSLEIIRSLNHLSPVASEFSHHLWVSCLWQELDPQPIDGPVQIERSDLDVVDLFIVEIQTGEPINQDHVLGHAASGPVQPFHGSVSLNSVMISVRLSRMISTA